MCGKSREQTSSPTGTPVFLPISEPFIDARVDELAEKGPMLRRPIVGEISGSRIHNMKELRASSGPAQLRVLFVFDPARTAILLLGGNKAEGSAWNSW